MGGATFNKSLIQFSVDGWGCVPSLLFELRANSGGGNEYNDNLLQNALCMHCYTHCPQPCSRPLPTRASAGDCWTLKGKSGSVSGEVIAPFSWVLLHTRFWVFFFPSENLFPQYCVSSGNSMVQLMVTSSKRAYATPRFAAPRAPAPGSGHCWSIPRQKTYKHTKAGLAWSLWGLLVCTRFIMSSPSVSGETETNRDKPCAQGLILNVISHLRPSCWGFSFALGGGISFFWSDATFSCWWLFSSKL